MSSLICRHLIISGQVQGVYYRQSTLEQAQLLGLAGWCRNLPDGRVEALVQGAQDAVETLIHWAYQGPPKARVQHIEVIEYGVDPALPSFEIRRDGP